MSTVVSWKMHNNQETQFFSISLAPTLGRLVMRGVTILHPTQTLNYPAFPLILLTNTSSILSTQLHNFLFNIQAFDLIYDFFRWLFLPGVGRKVGGAKLMLYLNKVFQHGSQHLSTSSANLLTKVYSSHNYLTIHSYLFKVNGILPL